MASVVAARSQTGSSLFVEDDMSCLAVEHHAHFTIDRDVVLFFVHENVLLIEVTTGASHCLAGVIQPCV